MQFSQPDMQQQQFENTSDLEESQGERNIKKKLTMDERRGSSVRGNQVPCHGGEVMCSRATCRRHDPFH